MKAGRRPSAHKIFSPAKAQGLCRSLARSGREVVFTNGCFDIIHPGHVSYLEAARAKGDFLIVALDTDAAVRALKGPDRPINDLKHRMRVIAGLESVDAVTWFDKGNPIPIIERLRPGVLVKGGDWKVADILGAKEVMSWGGRAFSLKFVPGKSTTSIVRKIRKR